MSSNNTSANVRKNKMLMIYLFSSAAVSNGSLTVTVSENDGNT